MKLIKLNVRGISHSQTQTGAYALILEEEEGERKLPVIVGSFEAQSIALALEKDLVTPRPITHDLFVSLCEAFQIKLVHAIIHTLSEGVFYSNLVFNDSLGEIRTVDSRTSDAVAIALRFDVPIFAASNVLDEAGVILDIQNEPSHETIQERIEKELEELSQLEPEASLKDLTLEELEFQLALAVEEEDYETAALIKEEIERRKKEGK